MIRAHRRTAGGAAGIPHHPAGIGGYAASLGGHDAGAPQTKAWIHKRRRELRVQPAGKADHAPAAPKEKPCVSVHVAEIASTSAEMALQAHAIAMQAAEMRGTSFFMHCTRPTPR